jgi:membrane-bound lytic murein transglycosylase D
MKRIFSVFVFLIIGIWDLSQTHALEKPVGTAVPPILSTTSPLKDRLKSLEEKSRASLSQAKRGSHALIFDLPVTYNRQVSQWITYFQTRGQKWFREYLERASKYMPFIQKELRRAQLPTDLGYMVMIESGFSANAVSSADAVGPWQFIESTGSRYGLSKNWWLDERRDIRKATLAAIRFIQDLYQEFGSWYLVAASYNMGEAGLRRKIQKHKTRDYWTLIKKNALPKETQEYVPKILAAMLISKAPNLYGFRDLERRNPLDYEVIPVPGGTDLGLVADHLGVTRKALRDLNSELLLGYVPKQVDRHYIRVPKGSTTLVGNYLQSQETAAKSKLE